MSTNINISVGDNKLLDQARLQQNAGRQAQLEKEANQRLAREAEINRVNALAAKGLDANGNPVAGNPTDALTVNRRPAANRISGYKAGGIFTRARRLNEISPFWEEGQSPYGNAAPYDIIVEIAASDSLEPTVFVIARPQPGSLYYNDESGSQVLPPLATLEIVGNSEAAAAAAVAAVEGVTNDIEVVNILNSADKTGFFYLPDGKGGIIIMYYVNVWFATDAYKMTLRRDLSYTRFWTIVEFVDQFGQIYKEFDSNPGCSIAGAGTIPTGQTKYLGREVIDQETEQVLATSYTDNAVFCFYVDKDKNISQIATPAGLLSKFQAILPPVGPNTTITTTIGGSFLRNRLRYLEGTGTFGQGGQGVCVPDAAFYDSGDQYTSYEITYDYFDPDLYDSYENKVNASLIYFFGSIPAAGGFAQAWGPSFGAFLLKGIDTLNMSNSTSYDYMETEYYKKRPAFFVSYCRVDSCTPEIVYWDYSKQRPSTYTGDLDNSDFTRSSEMGRVNLLPSAEYQQYLTSVFYYDLGLPSYCRQIVGSLNFSL